MYNAQGGNDVAIHFDTGNTALIYPCTGNTSLIYNAQVGNDVAIHYIQVTPHLSTTPRWVMT